MDGFQYTHGDQPLEGYTIQRAVGRGGFGEVYYALSDAGREVALKALHGFEQIEVRGVTQCMNLKSPHLVTIFDIKHNAQGKSFVIMEYVHGPSLKDLLEQSPAGMGAQKTAFFLREIAKGLSFLHERGIVHRDLKPGNILYEDGYVKIGDYGLSKAIGVSQHSGQTLTVGTVQYMAPEVGMGKYDRSIDIYALGIVLYEMLTGQVPFFGSSHGEILMKHLMSQPDLTGIEEPFATVIRKAMSKDPAERYQSVQEMVEAVFGAEHVRNSVSCFSPDSLTVVAGRVAQKVAVGAGAAGTGSSAANDGGYGTYKPPLTDDSSDAWVRVAQRVDEAQQRVRQRLEEAGERIRLRYQDRADRRRSSSEKRAEDRGKRENGANAAAIDPADPSRDPLERRQRRILAGMTTLAVAFGTGQLVAPEFGLVAVIGIPVVAIALIWSHRRFGRRLGENDGLAQRFAYNGVAAIIFPLTGLIWLPILTRGYVPRWDQTIYCTFFALAFIDWRSRILPDREDRISLRRAILAGVTGWVLALLLNGNVVAAAAIPAGISLTVQALAAFDPLARRAASARAASRTRHDPIGSPPHTPGADPAGAAEAFERDCGAPATPRQSGSVMASGDLRMLPGWARVIFTALFVLLTGGGILLLVFAGMTNRPDDAMIPKAVVRLGHHTTSVFSLPAICFGVGSLLFALFFMVLACRRTIRSYWSGLARPFLMLLCLQSGITSGIIMGNSNRLSNDELLIGLAFIIFPALLLFVLMFISNRIIASAFAGARNLAPDRGMRESGSISDRDAYVALLLALGGFCGLAGMHRFYVGRIWTGLLWLFTFGVFGLGTFFDLIMMKVGLFVDGDGRPLRLWMGRERAPWPGRRPRPFSTWPAVIPGEPRQPTEGSPAMTTEAVPSFAPAPSNPPAPPRPRFAPAATNIWLAALANLLLLVALILGVLLAIDLPRIVASGLPDASLERELTRDFGYPEWPALVWRIGFVLDAGMGFLSILLLLIARRHAGFFHMFRAALGFSGLLLATFVVKATFGRVDWAILGELSAQHQIPRGIDRLFSEMRPDAAIACAALFLVSILLLAWPERREKLIAPTAEVQ